MSPDPHSAAVEALDALAASGASLAAAESLTGGRVAAALTAVPGASRVFRGGVVSYATEVKIDVLGVPAALVEQHGVVSAACAEAMARGAARLLGATHAVATTGVAGPDEQEGKAVGTVFVGVATPDGVRTQRLSLASAAASGGRAAVQDATVDAALRLLLGPASADPPG